jgi:hypothetical protein
MDDTNAIRAYQRLMGSITVNEAYEVWVLLTSYVASGRFGKPKVDLLRVIEDSYPQEAGQ